MLPIRIAAVRYLNTAPLIEGLDKCDGMTLIPVVPSRIADLVWSGEADVGLVSIVDAVGVPGAPPKPALALIPAGMIGCDGPTLTVRLFSAVPIERITRLYTDTDSHTSIILAQLVLARRFSIRPPVVAFDVRERIAVSEPHASPSGAPDEAWPESVLLIGDKVVTDRPPASRYPHELDLGEAWHALTGLPFVYAMWMCRASEAGTQRIATAAAILDRQRRHNLTRLDWIIATRAPQARWPEAEAKRYIGELLRYGVGVREREAVERFLAGAADLGLVNRGAISWA